MGASEDKLLGLSKRQLWICAGTFGCWRWAGGPVRVSGRLGSPCCDKVLQERVPGSGEESCLQQLCSHPAALSMHLPVPCPGGIYLGSPNLGWLQLGLVPPGETAAKCPGDKEHFPLLR